MSYDKRVRTCHHEQARKRTDLIRHVEALLNGERIDDPDNANGDNGTPLGKKSIEITGEKYGLSKNSVARYIRVNNLIAGFKVLLDSEELSIRAGVSLSFLNEARQQIVLSQLERYEIGISMKQAEKIRKLDAEIDADDDNNGEKFLFGCADILVGKVDGDNKPKPLKTISIKLDRQVVASYFKEDDTAETIQKTVLEALALYRKFLLNGHLPSERASPI